MCARFEDGRVILEGITCADHAEPLIQLLLDRPEAPIDLGAVTHLHLSVLQVVLASGREIVGMPAIAHAEALLAGCRRSTTSAKTEST